MDVAGDLMLPWAHCKHVLQGHAAHQILTWTVRAAIAAAGELGRMQHPRAVGDTTAQASLHQQATTVALSAACRPVEPAACASRA